MTPHVRLTFLAATTALLAASAIVSPALISPAWAQSGDFRDCLQTIKADATRQGVPAGIADRAFQGLTPDQKVIDLDQRQPEFSLTYARYVGGTVSAEEVERRGGNKSVIHIDWMIGSDRIDIDGIGQDGSVTPVMRKGEWA